MYVSSFIFLEREIINIMFELLKQLFPSVLSYFTDHIPSQRDHGSPQPSIIWKSWNRFWYHFSNSLFCHQFILTSQTDGSLFPNSHNDFNISCKSQILQAFFVFLLSLLIPVLPTISDYSWFFPVSLALNMSCEWQCLLGF